MTFPTPSEFNTFTDYAYAVTVARSRKVYPSPFFDIASTYFPTNIKEMFKYIKFTISTNELVNVAVEKLSSYPITDLAYYRSHEHAGKYAGDHDENLPYIAKWRDMLDNQLQLKSKLKAIGKSYYGYGNAFVSLYIPFMRMMHCHKCKKDLPVKGLDYKYLPEVRKFEAVCQVCGAKCRKVWDQPRRSALSDFNIIVWDPSLIDLQYHALSDTSEIYYNMHVDERKRIKLWKDEDYINKTPLSFIQSIYEVKNAGRIKFNRNNIMHMRRDLIPGMFPGWGWPLPAAILKQAFYLQMLRKANETIFEQHILPFIALYPQPTQGLDVYRQVNLGDWKAEVQYQLDVWRRDPASFGIFPFPIGQTTIGGQGKAFELVQEAQNIAEAIVVGMGIPKEFVFGGMSWSASSVSVRIVENDMLNFREEMLKFPNKFLIPKLASILNWPEIHVGLQDFKMADDLQQQQLSFQMMSNRVISKQTFFKDIGVDLSYDDEQERIEKEIDDELKVQEKLAMSQAKTQGAASLIQYQYQAVGQGLQAQDQRLAQTPSLPPPPPPPPPDEQTHQAQQLLSGMFPADDVQKLMGMTSWQLQDLVDKQKITPDAMQAVIHLKSVGPEQQQMAAQMQAQNGPAPQDPNAQQAPQGGGDQGGQPSGDPMAVLQQLQPQVVDQLMQMPPEQLQAAAQSGQIPPEVVQAIMMLQQQQGQGQQPQQAAPQQQAPQAAPAPQQQATPQPSPLDLQASYSDVQAAPQGQPAAQPQAMPTNMPVNQPPAPAPTSIGMLPPQVLQIIQTLDKKSLEKFIGMDAPALLKRVQKGELPEPTFAALLVYKIWMAHNDPANPALHEKAQQTHEIISLPKAQIDFLVAMPTQQLISFVAEGILPVDHFYSILRKKMEGYQPAQVAAAPAPSSPPVSTSGPGQLQPMIPVSTAMPPQPAPQDMPAQPSQQVMQQPPAMLNPQQPPAQQMPGGQAPGGLMPPQPSGQAQGPQLPPEYMSPSGVPYSAAELLKAGVPPQQLLQLGYSPEDLKAAGVRLETLGVSDIGVPSDVLKLHALISSMQPAQQQNLMSQVQANSPQLAQAYMGKYGAIKNAMNPYDMLKAPPTASNIAGMASDMEAPWIKQDGVRSALKKILADFAAKQKPAAAPAKPSSKPPSENAHGHKALKE